MSEWEIEGKRQMLAEVTVAPLSLPWCKSGCSSPEYRWHYTSNPLNGWDTLTCCCLEWPASICSASAKPNTFVNLTAKSLSLGYGSEDISYYLLHTLSSPVNALHWLFYFLRCQWEEGTSSNLCRKLEQLFEAAWRSSPLKNQCVMENIAWMHNHLNKIEFWCGASPLVPSPVPWWWIGLNLWQLTLNTVGESKGRSPQDFQ